MEQLPGQPAGASLGVQFAGFASAVVDTLNAAMGTSAEATALLNVTVTAVFISEVSGVAPGGGGGGGGSSSAGIGIGIIAGAAAGGVVAVVVLGMFIMLCMRKRRVRRQMPSLLLEKAPPALRYDNKDFSRGPTSKRDDGLKREHSAMTVNLYAEPVA